MFLDFKPSCGPTVRALSFWTSPMYHSLILRGWGAGWGLRQPTKGRTNSVFGRSESEDSERSGSDPGTKLLSFLRDGCRGGAGGGAIKKYCVPSTRRRTAWDSVRLVLRGRYFRAFRRLVEAWVDLHLCQRPSPRRRAIALQSAERPFPCALVIVPVPSFVKHRTDFSLGKGLTANQDCLPLEIQ